jgi:hypothetical protein
MAGPASRADWSNLSVHGTWVALEAQAFFGASGSDIWVHPGKSGHRNYIWGQQQVTQQIVPPQ